MTYDEALNWAIEHNAITRFYDDSGKKMLRLTVEAPNGEDRITYREPVGDDAKGTYAQMISDMHDDFVALERRSRLVAV